MKGDPERRGQGRPRREDRQKLIQNCKTTLPKGRKVRSEPRQIKCKTGKTGNEYRLVAAREKTGTREAHSRGELNERKVEEAKPR